VNAYTDKFCTANRCIVTANQSKSIDMITLILITFQKAVIVIDFSVYQTNVAAIGK